MSATAGAKKSMLSSAGNLIWPQRHSEFDGELVTFDRGIRIAGATVAAAYMFSYLDLSTSDIGFARDANTAKIEACFQHAKAGTCHQVTLKSGRTYELQFKDAGEGCTDIVGHAITPRYYPSLLPNNEVLRTRCPEGTVTQSYYEFHFKGMDDLHHLTRTYGANPYEPQEQDVIVGPFVPAPATRATSAAPASPK